MTTIVQKAEATAADQKVGETGEVSLALTSKEIIEALIADVHRELERVQAEDNIFVAA